MEIQTNTIEVIAYFWLMGLTFFLIMAFTYLYFEVKHVNYRLEFFDKRDHENREVYYKVSRLEYQMERFIGKEK